MALDNLSIDLTRLESVRGFQMALQFDADGLRSDAVLDDGLRAQAKGTFAIWQTLAARSDAAMMILRRENAFSVVSKAGGLVLESSQPMNIGLIRPLFRDLADADAPPCDLTITRDYGAERNAIWGVAERLGRVETPRHTEWMVGQYEYVIRARKTGFDIIEDDGGADRLVEKIKEAVSDAYAIEYTFGDLSDAAASSSHTIAELFGVAEGNKAELDADGFPTALPRHVDLHAIQAAQAIQAALRANADGPAQLDVMNANGQIALRAKQTEDHAFNLTISADFGA